MALMPILAAGVMLLLVVGLWEIWRGRLDRDADEREELMAETEGLLSREDFRNPSRILDSPPKRRNLVMIVSEIVVLVMTAILGVLVLGLPNTTFPLEYKGLVGGGFFVGVYLLARALYVRLGLTRMFA